MVDNHGQLSYKELGLEKPEDVTEELLQRFSPSTARKGQRVAYYSSYGDGAVLRWDYGTITLVQAKHGFFNVKYDEFPGERHCISYNDVANFGIKAEVDTWCLGARGVEGGR
jgi:hypothetical protein